jgi:anti-anti-sigma factor
MHLAGEFDIATTPQLDRALRQPLIKSRLSVIDMRDVDFLDCSAVRALTAAGERARKDGHRLVLLAPRPSVERMFALTMTDQQNEIVHGEGFYALRG